MSLRTLHPAIVLVILLAVSASACKDAPIERVIPADESASGQIATPPSLTEGSGVAVRRIEITEQQLSELDLRTITVSRESIRYTLSLPGEVEPAPDNIAQVSAPISGRVAAIHAHEGETVRPGQPLLELESLEFANLAADYLQAEADETYARRQVDRLTTLVEKKISPQQALDKAQADLDRAKAGTRATYARLMTLGVEEAQLAAWTQDDGGGRGERPLLSIKAPIAGTIDKHGIALGQSVTAYQEMMTIVDPVRVLIKGFVSPDEAAALTPGDSVQILPENSMRHSLGTVVTTVNPAVDPESRAVIVNILADASGGWPLPGQTVRVAIRVKSPAAVMSVPPSAIVYDGSNPIVYVRLTDRAFERRPIVIDRTGEGEIIVASGLDVGDRVVTTQVFSLKALDRFTEYAE